MGCALCLANRPLLNSHIIPEFFFKQLYDNIHRFRVVPADPSQPEKFGQKGVREKLLCEICEQKFSLWEKYAKEAFGEGRGVTIKREGDLFKLANLDYRRFRLFLLSLLWRMGVSKSDFFSQTSLGTKHEEALRTALLNEDPLEPLNYPCLMTAVHIGGKFCPDWISQPLHNKSGSYHCHSVVISGILFNFYVTSHAPPDFLNRVCLSKSNELILSVSEIKDIPSLAEVASDLCKAIRSRAKRV